MKSWNVLLKQLLLSYLVFNKVVKQLPVSDVTQHITDASPDKGLL